MSIYTRMGQTITVDARGLQRIHNASSLIISINYYTFHFYLRII